MKNNKKKGFTLVELLVVIAIIAILAGVSIVGYLGFTEKAKQSNAVNELAQYKTAIIAELTEGEKKDNGVTFTLNENGKIDVTGTQAEATVIASLSALTKIPSDKINLNNEGTSETITSIEKITYTLDGHSATWNLATGEIK